MTPELTALIAELRTLQAAATQGEWETDGPCDCWKAKIKPSAGSAKG